MRGQQGAHMRGYQIRISHKLPKSRAGGGKSREDSIEGKKDKPINYNKADTGDKPCILDRFLLASYHRAMICLGILEYLQESPDGPWVQINFWCTAGQNFFSEQAAQ